MGKPVSREEILRRASEEPPSTALLQDLSEYLQANTEDGKIIEEVEGIYKMPLGKIRAVSMAESAEDFAETYSGECAWLRRYLDETAEVESPGIFHAMAALTVASAAIGKRTYTPMGSYNVYAPIAVVLVGPSGLRKTTTIRIARSILVEGYKEFEVQRFEERFTPEALASALKANSSGLVIAPEMAVTFGKAKYLDTLVPLLTRLLDHDKIEMRTMKGGTISVEGVTLGVLAGTTVEWMLSEMNSNVISGGFLSRMLLAYAPITPRLVSVAKHRIHTLALVEDLTDAVQACPEVMPLEESATRMLEVLYYVEALTPPRPDDLIASYLNRRQTHVVRLAMVFAVLAKAKAICAQHLKEALDLLRRLEPGMTNLYGRLSMSDTARAAEAIVRKLHMLGGASKRSRLLSACPEMTFTDVMAALSALEMMKRIKVEGDMISVVVDA